ncbi:restriction endonuclease subunit S [Photobacterium satsumensis]|uniref:restriction endonuclease subunit S n=1 Tax=Photobacterium satsumensis TaxID=2910239 RepID=UPI003D13B93F
MSQLPKGWVETTLVNIANWGSGGTPKRSESSYYGGDTPWVKTGDLGPKRLSTASEYISQAGLDNSSAKLFPKGSVAIAMYGATIGKTSILDFDTTTNQACAVGNPFEGVTNTEFLYYFLNSEKQRFIDKGKGGAQPNISQQMIKAHEVMLPPLAEQQRIVEKLDEVLAQVDTIKARLDGIPAIIKRFRQSVLAAAVSGKLTLLVKEPPKFTKLGDTGVEIKTGPFGSALHKSDYIEGGISVINPMHINDGKITPATQMSITSEKYESLAAWHLKDDDVVVGRRGEMGRAAVVKGTSLEPCLCGTGSMILRCGEYISSEYLSYVIRSPVAVSYFNATSVGSTMVNLNQKVIKSLEVYFPPIEEQKEIVRLVYQYFAFADTIEAQVKKAQARVDNLTQSILAKAFRGELVPQDSDDEPAEKLLERIAEARKEAEALAKAAKKAEAVRKKAAKAASA